MLNLEISPGGWPVINLGSGRVEGWREARGLPAEETGGAEPRLTPYFTFHTPGKSLEKSA